MDTSRQKKTWKAKKKTVADAERSCSASVTQELEGTDEVVMGRGPTCCLSAH
jgi:hypothetical protein